MASGVKAPAIIAEGTLVMCSRGVRGGVAPTPLDLHATLAAWFGLPRDRWAEGEALA